MKAYQDNVDVDGNVEYYLGMLYIKGNGVVKDNTIGSQLLKEAYFSPIFFV